MSHKTSKFLHMFKNLKMSSPYHFKTCHFAISLFVTPGRPILLFLAVNADNKLANVL